MQLQRPESSSKSIVSTSAPSRVELQTSGYSGAEESGDLTTRKARNQRSKLRDPKPPDLNSEFLRMQKANTTALYFWKVSTLSIYHRYFTA